jgi:hypothetical protein
MIQHVFCIIDTVNCIVLNRTQKMDSILVILQALLPKGESKNAPVKVQRVSLAYHFLVEFHVHQLKLQ